MLLPILIFQPNVKKRLWSLVVLASKQELIKWAWNLINTTNTQLFHLPLIATTTTKTYYLLGWLPQNIHESLTDKHYYVFADHQQTHQNFFQQMGRDEQDALLQELKFDYQEILISYFTTDRTLKGKIDKFINAVFCANIPVPQIIEIHMEVIEEFSKQLRLEGRSDETLLDYRLTLIDILAHLCETYRCSMYK
ncbi:KaiA family protein [Calothrix sp. PCC 7507]|uniref:KaiA family protein n=1 Tax=Calothrix sp. PCC 7507 TaxID=99598 RepID=UPI00029F4475|nr:KaiA family protein [Calothrix sp. PCC 7507]AFY35524.1 KaiA family protein [Calothrix sp. PCC 7507]